MNPRMNAQEWSRLWGIIVDEWPTLRRLTERGGWYDDVKYHDPSDVQAAIHQLRRTFIPTTSMKEPALARLLQITREVEADRRRQTSDTGSGDCGSCYSGHVFLNEQRDSPVRDCPNGCRTRYRGAA